jgi:hypothetical protein
LKNAFRWFFFHHTLEMRGPSFKIANPYFCFVWLLVGCPVAGLFGILIDTSG